MGLAQSHAEFFQLRQHDVLDPQDVVDPLMLLYRVERKFWRNEPEWLKPPPRNQRVVEVTALGDQTSEGAFKPHSSGSKPVFDPMGPMTTSQALALVPSLMDEKWIAPLVAIIDSLDGMVQSVGLALLAAVVRSATADQVFISVGGVDKVMELLETESPNSRYLALEVIHALCSRDVRFAAEFCGRGLVQHLAHFASLDGRDFANTKITLASLKILRHVLPHCLATPNFAAHKILPILLKQTQSTEPTIANVAVINIGLSLSDTASIAEVVESRCVETLLKLALSPVGSPHAVLQALSLIAEQDVELFPKELTLLTISKTLDTLRGAAKRSKNASACAYLFASLARSNTLRNGLCTETNLSILSKLLIGGSTEVLKAASLALGMAAYEGSRAINQILFLVDAPDNLLKLLDNCADEELMRLVLFSLGTMLDMNFDQVDAIDSGIRVDVSHSGALIGKTQILANNIVAVGQRYELVTRYLNEAPTSGMTFAAKIVCYACTVGDSKVSASMGKPLLLRLLGFLGVASHALLRSLLYFFVNCSRPVDEAHQHCDGARFCELLASIEGCIDMFTQLFVIHEPPQLSGLATVFCNFASLSSSLRCQLSEPRVIDVVMDCLSRASNPWLQKEALAFLVEITRQKNRTAIANIYNQSPDRVANASYSSDSEVVALTLEVLRRLFKHHNSSDIPISGTRRQLVNLLSDEDLSIAVAAARVWGNLMLHLDKRRSFAVMTNAVEMLLRLLQKIADESSDEIIRTPVLIKNSLIVIRALARGLRECGEMKKETAGAPSFLVVFEYFDDSHQSVMVNAVEVMKEVAAVPVLRKSVVVPQVLGKLTDLLNDRDLVRISSSYRIEWLKFVIVVCKRDNQVQRLLAEFGVVDAITLLVHSPAATLDMGVLKECVEALAWLCSKNPDVRRKIASSPKLIDLALRYIDCSIVLVVAECLHLLQRLTSSDDCKEEKNKIRSSGGVPAVIRAIQSTSASVELKVRACALVRNLVTNNEVNRNEFQRLGFVPVVLRLIATSDVKLQIRGLHVVAVMCEGTSSAAKANKVETLECEYSQELLQIVQTAAPPKLLLAWCNAAVSLAQGSAPNQKKLVDAQLTMPIVKLTMSKAQSSSGLQITASRLLAILSSLPVNRNTVMAEGGDTLLSAFIIGLQSEVHDVQRYTALLIAYLTTRNDQSKIRIGAGGTAACLIDRLSSKQLNVVENVLQAIVKLGSHAGNKVKFGSRVCFEKLLLLVHHEELPIRKGAVSAIAALIEGNDANKRLLLQCEASVVTELCALMKSANGKIVESSMLILGELSQLSDQTLEISKYIDIVSIVRMIEHHNLRVRRAALHTVLNLTKESFNKLRFGIQECIAAMLSCLQSEDMLIVELAATSLANLSFLEANASKIAKRRDSIGVLLKLAAASTTSNDYLSWNEARLLGLGKEPGAARTSPRVRSISPVKQTSRDESMLDDWEVVGEEDEIDDKLEPFVYSAIKEASPEDSGGEAVDQQELLDFSFFPARQTSVLEQTLLVVSNCANTYHDENVVERVAIKVVCQALSHPSELVKRCACYILAVWCKKDTKNQRTTTKQGILPVLIQLLSSPNVSVVEAATYLLGKLAYYEENHMKLLQLDLLTTLVQSILRKPSNITHDGLVDRTIRLLGTLVRFTRVRQTIKSEEIVADILTQLLQIHHSLAKNISRLILGMLEEDSLRFFLPKKTVMILRVLLTDTHSSTPKTTRNILSIFQRIASVEEHKTTIALEDSGEALTRMVLELCPVKKSDPDGVVESELPPNSPTVLSLLACLSSTRKVALILHENDVYATLPLYVMTTELPSGDAKEKSDGESAMKQLFAPRQLVLDALLTARNMCSALGDRAGTRLSNVNFSSLLLELLRVLGTITEDGKLIPEVHECFAILDRLSMYSRDQQHFAEDCAVEVVHHYLQQWIEAAEKDGTLEGRQDFSGGGELVCYVTPMVKVLLRLAEHDINKALLVRDGGIPLVLQSLHVSLLNGDLLLLLARSLRLLCALPSAVEWFDTQDVVMPLFRFMHIHRHLSDLLLLCLGCLADILENSVSSRRRVIGQPQVLKFFLDCLRNPIDDPADKIHYAINALECMSMEPELTSIMAELDSGLLHLVSSLLLVPADLIARSTQYFAIEMIGYMASYGHGDKLGLGLDKLWRIVAFLDFSRDETITGEVIALTMWTLAHLVRRRSSTEGSTPATLVSDVPHWIAAADGGIDLIVKAGLTPSEQLGTSSSVTANTLTVLLAICTSTKPAIWIPGLIKCNRGICTSLSAHLEAVEREINLPALRLLAICMATTGCENVAEDASAGECENWATIFRHLMEWMEVYARDPEQCPGPSLADAFICLSQITMVDSLTVEFKACINRSGLAEIVGNAIIFLDPKRQSEQAEDGEQDQERHQVLLNALKICGNLMACTTAYSERFFLLGVPQAIENVLMIDDDELILESLVCMSWLADWTSTRQLLFSSLRCVLRLTELLAHKSLSIVAKITPLLVLMCSRIPSLPGLCTVDGIQLLCDRLSTVSDWNNRDRYETRITEDCATIILSIFSPEDTISALFKHVDVVGKMFDVVVKSGAPEVPLRILTKISSSARSHPRFLQLLDPLCRLLQGSSQHLGGSSQHLALCILFNVFCRVDDAETAIVTLRIGEKPVLQQLLPLKRWIGVPNVASVRIAIKILHTYVSSISFRGLLNDGRNIPALLRLIADTNDDVSAAAAQLLLTAISEREVEIAVTVEDGIAVVVRTLQKTSKWRLQCLLLSILKRMCHDAEVPVLIMNEDGVSRLVHFVRERKGVLFAADERLALSCKILRYVSAISAPGAASRIVESRGHTRLIELATHQEATTNDSERATTMEILSNLAVSGEVSVALAESKLHDYCLKAVLSQPPPTEPGRDPVSPSRSLALLCLRAMCKYNKSVRLDLPAAKPQLVDMLEIWLQRCQASGTDSSATSLRSNAIAVLKYLSKTLPGRLSIFTRTSSDFVVRVSENILADQVLIADKTHGTAQSMKLQSVSVASLGVKLLGNLLSDQTPERFRVKWACGDLVRLLSLLQNMLSDHQQPKLQLHCLNLMCGAYDGGCYLPISAQMLSDLINIVLISPTPRHATQAEHTVIKAFEREQEIQVAIVGSQVLEQLLIVFSQRAEVKPAEQVQRLPLAPALTHVLNFSMARGFLVNPRFISKIVTLLSTSSLALKAESCLRNGSSRFSNPIATLNTDDGDEDALVMALTVYLGFVHKSSAMQGPAKRSEMNSLQHTIRHALRAEVNIPALTTIFLVVLNFHMQICTSATPETKSPDELASSGRDTAIEPQDVTQRDLLLWSLLSHCLQTADGESQPAHLVSLLQELPHDQWLCLLADIFDRLSANTAVTSSKRSSNSSNATTAIMPVEGLVLTLRILAVVASHSSRSESLDVLEKRIELCISCLRSILFASEGGFKSQQTILLLQAALDALVSIRSGWGEDIVVKSLTKLENKQAFLSRWMGIFLDTNAELDQSRVASLQLFLLMASSGSCVEDLKAAGIRTAIENNEVISAADKSVVISILGLLGYNSDLNAEFQLAVDRLGEAEAFTERKDALTYLTNFLQLYSLTDESSQERAIDCCMRHLVEYTSSVAREASQAKTGDSEAILACIRDYLSCLIRLSHDRNFVDLYMKHWNTNALLNVCFSRRRAVNSRGFKECSVLSLPQISDVIDMCSKFADVLSATTSAGTLSDTTFLNAMTLLDDLPLDQTSLCERILALLAWCVENEDTFDLLCNFAARLRSVLRYITLMSNVGFHSLTTLLDTLTKQVPQIELLGELLTELLTCIYRNAGNLKNFVRERLLLYILTILKRMGEDDLTACSIYEHSIQVILTNVHVPSEMAARCSWDLLGILSELDPAIVTLFNFDGVQIMLKAFCEPTGVSSSKTTGAPSTPIKRVLSTRKSALSAPERAALAGSSAAANEAVYRRLEALKCLSKAARNHDEVLQKIGEFPGIAAHLFRVLSGPGSGAAISDSNNFHAVTSVAQEHATHLIARISSQELFRASLLSQDHMTCLIESLESVHPKIVLYALEALFYLSEFAMCLEALVRHATVPVLAQIFVSTEDQGHMQHNTELFVLGLLASMCAKSKVIGRRVVSSNLLPRLRVFLTSPQPRIQFYAIWVVKSVSKDPELVAKLHEQGIAEVVCDMLPDYEPLTTRRKAFGALCNMITGHRPGMVFMTDEVLQRITRTVVQSMYPHVVSPQPNVNRSLSRGLTVLEAVASLSSIGKAILCDDEEAEDSQAIPLTLQLLDSVFTDVKLRALHAILRWIEDNPDKARVRQILLVEAPLLSIVRAISEERGESLLVALTLLNTVLAIDEELKVKLAAMTNEVLLRLLPTLVPQTNPSLSPMQLRALNEALKSLVAMTRSSNVTSPGGKSSSGAVAPNQFAAVENALDPLVELLRLSTASDNLRLNALYLLVNFAGSSVEVRPKLLSNGTMVACIRTLLEPHDDKLLQLCLLGMALLTSNGIDFSSVVPDLLEVVDVLLRCLLSRNASVQANAVWVVSNICGEERLKTAIASRGGATTLQSILNEIVNDTARRAPSALPSGEHTRPLSSSQRIREYAPKAIKSLGFSTMTPGS